MLMNKHLKNILYTVAIAFIVFLIAFFAYNVEERISISHESGFYDSEFYVKIRANRINYDIIYTTDGSIPDINNLNGSTYLIKKDLDSELQEKVMMSHLYDSKIHVYNKSESENYFSTLPNTYFGFTPPSFNIDKAFVLRAAVYRNGKMGDVETRVYFVGDEFKQYNSLSTLSLIIQEDDLWDYEKGIYVPGVNFDPKKGEVSGNHFMRGDEWERPVYAEFFDKNGNPGFAQNMGIRIHGGSSRAFVNRSFRLYARSDYGESTIEYPLFKHSKTHQHKRLKLRNSGQDASKSYFRDALMGRLMNVTEVNTEDYHPINLFINGEYWGIFNIRERFDHHYVERNYGIDRENVEVVNRWDQAPEDYIAFREILKDLNPSNPMFHHFVKKNIDILSFLDNKIAEIFFGSWDLHWKMWRDKSDSESKWRWVLWDFDYGMGYEHEEMPSWIEESSVETDFLEPFMTDYKTKTLNFEFSTIIQNKRIQNIFINRFAEMMAYNLSKENIIKNINDIKNEIETSMPKHIERWQSVGGIPSMDAWKKNIEKLTEFAIYRHEHIYNHIISNFELEGTSSVHFYVDCDEGEVFINNWDFKELSRNESTWECVYFKNVPIRLSVDFLYELTFFGWEINGELISNEMEIVFTPKSDNYIIKALFM